MSLLTASIQQATRSALFDAQQVITDASDFSVEGFETPDSREDGYWSIIISYTPKRSGITKTTTINSSLQMREYKNLLLNSNYSIVAMTPYIV
jgi:hypothetical protein